MGVMCIESCESSGLVSQPWLVFTTEVQYCRVFHDPVQIVDTSTAQEILGIITGVVVPHCVIHGKRLVP